MKVLRRELGILGIVIAALSSGCSGSGSDTASGGDASSGGHASSSNDGGDGGGRSTASGNGGHEPGTGGSGGAGGSGGSDEGSGWIDAGSGVPASPVQPGLALACTVTVGTGSGSIQLDASTPGGLHSGDVVCIAPGTYDGMTVADLHATGSPITIQNGGAVTFTGLITLTRLENITLSGAGGMPGTMNPNGITLSTFQDAIDVTGKTDKLTIRNIDFKNVGRIGVQFLDKSIHYDGSDEPLYTNIKLLDLSMDHTAFHDISFSPYLFIGATDPVMLDDGTTEPAGQVARSNLARDVEIANCDFQYGQPQMALYLGNVFDVNVHHVRMQHVNIGQTGHIEMIFLQGNGKIHHNYVEDYRGMVARVFPCSWDQDGLLDIYDNIALDAQWYSDYEINPSQADLASSSRAHPTNTRIYGNTTGNLGIVQIDDDPKCQDYQAVLVDDYLNPEWYSGTLDVRNNLVYQTVCPSYKTLPGAPPTTVDIISPWQGDVCSYGNLLYFDTYQDAGLVDSLSAIPSAGSPVIGAGAPLPLIATDFFGRTRSATAPTVGAVERP